MLHLQKNLKSFLSLALLAFGGTHCSDRVTPWATQVASGDRNLTAENLDKVANLPDQELPFTFALIADPQGTPRDFEDAADRINELPDVRFVLVLGDMTDYGMLHEYEWAADAMHRLHVPFLTVIGNHDGISHGKSIYERMFGPFNYTFNFAGIKFLMWNNNQYEFGSTDFDWLRDQADNNSIVNSHIPPVEDTHSAEQLVVWKQIYQDKKIIASLHGHRGTRRDFYGEEMGIPVYVTARTRGVRYSLVTVNADRSIKIQSCTQHCDVTP